MNTNLVCDRCWRASYSASPQVFINTRCHLCGGKITYHPSFRQEVNRQAAERLGPLKKDERG